MACSAHSQSHASCSLSGLILYLAQLLANNWLHDLGRCSTESPGLAGARHVYACEWNPAAVHALKHNLNRNGVAERCTVLEGDCTFLAPQVRWRKPQHCFLEGISCRRGCCMASQGGRVAVCELRIFLLGSDNILHPSRDAQNPASIP